MTFQNGRNRLNFLQLYYDGFHTLQRTMFHRTLTLTPLLQLMPTRSSRQKAQNLEQNHCYAIQLTNHIVFYDLFNLCSPHLCSMDVKRGQAQLFAAFCIPLALHGGPHSSHTTNGKFEVGVLMR